MKRTVMFQGCRLVGNSRSRKPDIFRTSKLQQIPFHNLDFCVVRFSAMHAGRYAHARW